MYNLGTYQLLDIEEKTGEGFLLKGKSESQTVMLPNEEVLGQVDVGDSVMVYLYHDAKQNLLATMKEAKVIVGDFARLKVVEILEFGAFLDNGLSRDLFLPKKEINYDIEKGKAYLVYCYVDKTERVCATTRVYDHLSVDHTYQQNDTVTGTVYRINPDVGVFVAVDNKYYGMIPNNEYFEDYKEGDEVTLRVIRLREDMKLDLSTRQLIKDQIVVDSEKIYFELVKAGGKLMYHDKSTPEEIKSKFAMSKKAFKRALGRLMKEEKIEIYENYIEKKEKPLN